MMSQSKVPEAHTCLEIFVAKSQPTTSFLLAAPTAEDELACRVSPYALFPKVGNTPRRKVLIVAGG